MASYQVLAAPKNVGFLSGLGEGFSKGAADYSNIYSKAVILDKLKGKKEKQPMTPKQMAEAIKGVVSGVAPAESLPNFDLLTQQEESENPGMSDMMDAGLDVTDENNNPVSSYGDLVKESLQKNYFPGYTEDQVKQSMMGMPAIKENKVDTLDSDITAAIKGEKTWSDVVLAHPSKTEVIQKAKMFQEINKDEQPESGAEVKPKYKPGDTREINGVTYIRNAQGQWLPQS